MKIFMELIPASDYRFGVANHACADPEYVHIPAHILETDSPDYCAGVNDAWGPWCDDCNYLMNCDCPF